MAIVIFTRAKKETTKNRLLMSVPWGFCIFSSFLYKKKEQRTDHQNDAGGLGRRVPTFGLGRKIFWIFSKINCFLQFPRRRIIEEIVSVYCTDSGAIIEDGADKKKRVPEYWWARAARSRGTGIWLEPAPASILPGSFIFYVNCTVGTLH